MASFRGCPENYYLILSVFLVRRCEAFCGPTDGRTVRWFSFLFKMGGAVGCVPRLSNLPLDQASKCQDSALRPGPRSFPRVYSAFSLFSFFVLENRCDSRYAFGCTCRLCSSRSPEELKVSPHNLHLNFFSCKIPSRISLLILKSSWARHLVSYRVWASARRIRYITRRPAWR